jgi:hypothetical protein
MKNRRRRAAAVRSCLATLPQPAELTPIVEAVTRRAEEQGYILARQVREELEKADADPRLWKQILREAGPVLERRRGHYSFVPAASPQRLRQVEAHERIRKAVYQVVGEYRKTAGQKERREDDRIAYFQPVKIELPDGRSHEVLTRDISSSGMRLLGSRDLLGQKVRVLIPRLEGPPFVFVTRIVWTCRVGDDLYENGGMFLELADG